jgi:hypothetical protein
LRNQILSLACLPIPPRAHPNYEQLAKKSDLKFDFVPLVVPL